MGRLWLCSKLGSNHKESVLYADEAFSVGRLVDICQQQTNLGIQFVDSAVAFKAGTGFIDTLPANKRGGSGISGLGIYFWN